MAPNIPLGTNFGESEETSSEVVFEAKPRVPEPPVPRLFNAHLPRHFQDPDSLNQQIPLSRSPQVPPPTIRVLTPLNPRITLLEEESLFREGNSQNGFQNRNSRRRFLGHDPALDSKSSPSFIEGTVLPKTLPTLSSNPSGDHGSKVPPRDPSTILQVPATRIPGRVASSSNSSPQSTKDIPALETSDTVSTASTTTTTTSTTVATTTAQDSVRSSPPPPPPPPSTAFEKAGTTPSSSTPSHLDLGVLKLPGHEPEAPADLILIHHDRAIDTQNQTGLDGIFVKDESNFLTPEGATALILVGLCSVFLVFICFIMFVQKIRRHKIERKVNQDDGDLKPTPRYEATGTTTTTFHQSNPLSFLPPDILHALMHPGSLAKEPEIFEDPKPAFLTMEPPQPGNQLGRLWFSVYYDYVKSTLVLHILHARYVKGRGSSTNPGTVWVEACVLTPMNTIKASKNTDTRRASLAPVFNQNFRFQVEDEEVTQYLLRLTLYDKHPQNGEKAVGSVIVPLSTVDLCSTETISRDLQ